MTLNFSLSVFSREFRKSSGSPPLGMKPGALKGQRAARAAGEGWEREPAGAPGPPLHSVTPATPLQAQTPRGRREDSLALGTCYHLHQNSHGGKSDGCLDPWTAWACRGCVSSCVLSR